MKKVISLLIILVLVLSGCSTEKIKIKNGEWNFSRISESETDRVVFCSEENTRKFPDAEISNLEFVADKNTITITKSSSQESWTLEYMKSETAKTNSTYGAVYDIYYKNDDKLLKGYASTGIANRSDVDDEDYYLIITIGGYSLYFIDTLD